MKLKHSLELKAWLNLGLVFFFVALAFSGQVKDTFGWVFLIPITGYCGFVSYRNFQAAKTARDEEREYLPPTDATPMERVAFYTRLRKASLFLAPICFVVLYVLVVLPEDGTGEGLRLPKILVALHTNLGAWATILSIPSLMLVAAAVYHWKIKRILDGKE